jgi:phosphomevalonate kinase
VKVFAPGKLVLTGAYAVLEGAPAISIAVSRGAYADSERSALNPTPEVRAALGPDVVAPHADASDMFVGARKLGLGASAAILVASLGAVEGAAGADLRAADTRARLFQRARDAHAAAQSGGSGVDVATSVYGGAIRYQIGESVQSVALPTGLVVTVFACGTSARTTELRAQIDAMAAANPSLHRTCMNDLVAIANDAAAAVERGSADGLIEALQRTARALDRRGTAAQVGIVPPNFDDLEALAARERASFTVSGAGGGDVAVYLGPTAPSPAFLERAHALGLFVLPLALDEAGVRRAPADTPRAFPIQPSLQGHS